MQFHYFSICKVNCLWFIKYFWVVPHWICFRDWKAILQNLRWGSEYATAYFVAASSTYRVLACPQPIFNPVISKSFLTLSKGRSWGYWSWKSKSAASRILQLNEEDKRAKVEFMSMATEGDDYMHGVPLSSKGGFLFIWASAEVKRTQKEGVS